MVNPTVLSLLAALLVAPQPVSHGPEAAAARKTVAVLRFDNNSGNADYDPLGKGIAAMMITDLSSVEAVQVGERERMQDLVGEMQMQQSKLFDPKTAVQLGKLVGAEYVVTGALMALDPKLRIDTRVIRVSTGEIVKTAKRTGARTVGPVPLPTRIERFSVIRSSFIDKDSQEQFEIRTHKRLIDVMDPGAKTIEDVRRYYEAQAPIRRGCVPELPGIR